jgi:hypothetical protein
VLHTYIEAIGWLVIVGVAWKLSGVLSRLDTTVNLIMTNHLPHIEQAVNELREDFRALVSGKDKDAV